MAARASFNLLIAAVLVLQAACHRPYEVAETTESEPAVAQTRKGQEFALRLDVFEYLGAFRVPLGEIGNSSFSYGGTALAFNPHQKSLFIVGHDHHQAVAEIEIPDVINSTAINDLKTAKVLQPFANIKSRIPRFTLEGNTKIGGLMVVGEELIGTVFQLSSSASDEVSRGGR